MKILHVSTPHSWRGGEQQLAYLIEELNDRGVEQEVICAEGSAVEFYCKEKKIAYHTFNRNNFLIMLASNIHEICLHRNITLIHTHDAHAHTAVVLSSIFFGNTMPVIVSRRTMFPIGTNWFSRFKYNHASVSRIVCVSKKINEQVSKTIVESEKIVTVHSGIDLSKFKKIDEETIRLSDFGTNLPHPFIGNVSALSEEKDLFTFVNTAVSYFGKGKSGTFFIIGEGSYRSMIEKYIEEKGMTDKIILTGFQKNVTDIIRQLDCFLFTSHTEGFGTSLLDAMACRVPVVATRTGGIPEIVLNGHTGLLAPVRNAEALAECLIKITEHPSIRKSIVDSAYIHVYNFTKQRMATSTLNIYQQVIFEKYHRTVPVYRTPVFAL